MPPLDDHALSDVRILDLRRVVAGPSCTPMGREDLIDDPELGNDRSRVKRRDEVTKMLEDWLAQFPDVDAAVAELERFDVPCAPVLSIAEATQHPHLRERGTVQAIDDPVHGPVEIPAMPIRWGELPNRPPVDSPTLGQPTTAKS